MEADWKKGVLDFWFTELTPEQWFTANEEIDTTIRNRFEPILQEFAEEVPDEARTTVDGALAGVILCDQFPRNIYRRTSRAFAFDRLALDLCHHALSRGFDKEMETKQKQFLYMPLMHSEAMGDQDRAVELFTALGNENARKYAVEHRDIIARFGRFPHRNRVLDRDSTQEEEAFLEGHEGYGQ
ncbi:DUF924 family protein [Nitratireductor basaltis]|uniref:Transmembrane protein n=1 Tax=Nitratireductor basaltis TaxID=472175 RepID=A0A084UE57_9HYPH|nr:DUF924 family protein [Nitratireductor basaltis]KFB11243.1 hypothetical protein EL18_02290 [Nitratireductor basaltis]